MNCGAEVIPFIVGLTAFLLTAVYLGVGWLRAQRRAQRSENVLRLFGVGGARLTNSGHKSRGRDFLMSETSDRVL
jgi:hypothetical protein